MNKFHLTVVTPKGIFLDQEVEELYLKTSIGYMGILAKHDTLLTGVEIAPGFIKTLNKKEYYAIFNGVINITKDGVRLIVSNIEHADSIDVERAKRAHERALERLKKKGEGIDVKRAELALKRAITRIASSQKELL